jgi:transketolase
VLVQPTNAAETRALLRWSVDEADSTVGIRLAIGPSPRRIELPDAAVRPGCGHILVDGDGQPLVAYGPVMVNEALRAAEALAASGVHLRVVAMPWLNRFDPEWLAEEVAAHQEVFVLEDHAPVGGLADALRRELSRSGATTRVTAFGIEGWPACGTPPEALRAHGLDGKSLAGRIEQALTVSVER